MKMSKTHRVVNLQLKPQPNVKKGTESLDGLVDVFLQYQGILQNMIRRIVPSHDVEDVVQETFIRVYEAEINKHIEYPKSYMYKTARNLALNYITKKDFSSTTTVEDIDDLHVNIDNSGLSDEVESKEKFRLFCKAVRNLPVQCQRAFILKRVFGHSTKQVAQELGISQSTAEKHIAKGVLRCADFLHSKGYDYSKSSTKQRSNKGRY